MAAIGHAANLHQALAQYIANPRVLSAEEKLFQIALKRVEEEREQEGKLPRYFDNLLHARTIEDVRYAVELERKGNSFWTKDIGKKWLKHLTEFGERIYHYKVVLDAVVTRSECEATALPLKLY